MSVQEIKIESALAWCVRARFVGAMTWVALVTGGIVDALLNCLGDLVSDLCGSVVSAATYAKRGR